MSIFAVRAGFDDTIVPSNRTKNDGPGELYNRADDIGERKNFAAEKPEKVKNLRAKIDAAGRLC